MATPLFAAKPCYPGLDLVPAPDDSDLLPDCTLPAPLAPVTICPPFALPPPVPVVDRVLHVTVTRGPVSGRYDWLEATPDGDGGWTPGPRSGLIARFRWATEANAIPVAPGPTVYRATLVGGTGRCVFVAPTPPTTRTTTTVVLTGSPSANCYDWSEVQLVAGAWAMTGRSGSCAAGTGVSERVGLPVPADGSTVYTMAADAGGALSISGREAGAAVVALTGSGGIPKATDATHPGSATVTLCLLQGGAWTSTGVAWTMYNNDPSDAVSPNVLVQGKFVAGGVLVHDYELCA